MLAIAGGQLSTPLPDSGSDEIGRMADALRVFRNTAVEVEEQNLRERQVVLDTIDYGVLILDANLRVKMHNRAFRELWGIDEETLRALPLWRDLLETYRNRDLHGVQDGGWDAYVVRRWQN
jgi:PAS domain-containing protein